MNPYLDFKQKAAGRLSRFVNDPDGLLAYLRPFQQSAPEHQRLRPARPRPTGVPMTWKPLTPAPAPRAFWKYKPS